MSLIKQTVDTIELAPVPLIPKMQELIAQLEEIVSNPVVEAGYNHAIANVVPIIDKGKLLAI